MGISKTWLEERIKNSKEEVSKNVKVGNTELGNLELGKLQGYEECFKKLTESPIKKITKEIDHDKGFEAILRYYIDKKRLF